MAEIAVNLVINKLVPLVKEESTLLRGVGKEADSLIAELQMIKPILRNADERGDVEDGVNAWVKQLRQVSHQIEDVIDEYILHLAPQYRSQLNLFHKVSRFITNLKQRYGIAHKIQDIKETLCKVKKRGEEYGFNSIEQGGEGSSSSTNTWKDPLVASLFIEEAELVGIESPRKKLISWLQEEGSKKREVMFVVGMGGIGKTTLARKVYDDVIQHFDCHAWIQVSQSYKTVELFKALIRQSYKAKGESTPIPGEIDIMNDDVELIENLRKFLKEKRYLVVFDDVWDQSFWESIKNALPDNDNKGSRVIITTRDDSEATSFYQVHKLLPLPADKAWELFSKKAFQSDTKGICPPELENLSNEILKRCDGLPLAIVTIGGVLASKKEVALQWKIFLDSLGSQLASNVRFKGIQRVLSLSYIDLPYYLKPCYLYFGIFPEDYSISCVRLMRLWIAEGFVKGEEGKTLENVAQEYLAELIKRSLVQVSWVDFAGKARTCRVHNLMREIILSISNKLEFCYIFPSNDPDKSGGFEARQLTSWRRLSIHKNASSFQMDKITGSRIRSAFRFDRDELLESFVQALFGSFKLLKVLDFQDAPMQSLPNEVGDLFHLSYLSVRNTKTKALPSSIGRLHNLLTLDLKMSLVSELPVEIKSLRKLRHLLVYHYVEGKILMGVKIWEGFGCLEALQKLCFVEANHGRGFIKQLRKLKELRRLGIKNLKTEDGKALCSAIEMMSRLESLSVYSIDNGILDLQHDINPPEFLERLYLHGRLDKFPSWITKLQNLVRIRLFGSGLTEEEDPLKFLKALPNLLELALVRGYDGKTLHFKAGEFQKLKVLDLHDLNALNSVTIEDGALRHLQELSIGPCPQLKEVPLGIQHLKEITLLRFFDMPHDFAITMLPDEGQNYWVVKHIPIVLFNKEDWLGNCRTYSLR